MSQKKVEAYKEYKKNKEKYIKKEKRSRRIELIAALLVCAALVFWIGFSIAQNVKRAQDADTSVEPTTYINATEYQTFVGDLDLTY
ncbi:MAG: hypothetical protein ACSW75_03690 [Lachnospiraceae bacterium]